MDLKELYLIAQKFFHKGVDVTSDDPDWYFRMEWLKFEKAYLAERSK